MLKGAISMKAQQLGGIFLPRALSLKSFAVTIKIMLSWLKLKSTVLIANALLVQKPMRLY